VVAVATSATLLAAPFAGKAFKPDDVDRAMASEALQPLRGRADVLVVGTPSAAPDVYRTMFHLASLARGSIVPDGRPVAAADLAPDVRILLLLPGAAYDGAGDRAQVGPLTRVELRDASR